MGMRPLGWWICGSVRHFSTALQAPVIVAGAGPTGLVLGLHLARHGIKSVVVERSTQLTSHPQAHFINNRTMEVFRHLDGLADEVTALSPPLEEWRRFVYCRSLSGELLGQVDHFEGQSGPCNPKVSPEPLAHLPQNRLLPLLMRRVQEQQHLIKVMMGCSVLACTQSVEGVQVRVRDQQDRQLQLQGSFLAAADGAYSAIRNCLGVPMDGDPGIQHLINIHFVSRRMGQLAAARPGMLYFVFNAQAVAVLVAHNIQEGEFVAQVPYFPPLQSVGDFSREACLALVRASAGLPDLQDIEIKQINPWTMSAEVARRFSDGRVFLLGDAAHRFPPAGGFGMNTGVQDAHNLAWKLAAVLKGWASQQLLDSYEQERKPIAEANTALSVANWKEAIRLPQALGLDPDAANLVSRLVSSAPLPQALGKRLLDGALDMGRLMAAAPLGPLDSWRKGRVSRILSSGETLRLQFPQEDLGFVYRRGALLPEPSGRDAPRQHGGTEPRMRGVAYVPSSAPGCRLPHCWLDDEGASLQTQEHTSSSCPAPLPDPASHTLLPLRGDGAATWDIRLSSSGTAGEAGQKLRVSTLDLVAAAAPEFLLLVDCAGVVASSSGPDGSSSSDGQDGGDKPHGQAGSNVSMGSSGQQVPIGAAYGMEWAQAVLGVVAELSLPIRVVAILGADVRTVDGAPSAAAAWKPALLELPRAPVATSSAAQQLFPAVKVVYAADAAGGCSSPLPGVILVRPDGHVAWRWLPEAAPLPPPAAMQARWRSFRQQLLTAVNCVLGR